MLFALLGSIFVLVGSELVGRSIFKGENFRKGRRLHRLVSEIFLTLLIHHSRDVFTLFGAGSGRAPRFKLHD